MANTDGIPALLAPLAAECPVVEGGAVASAAARAIAQALADPAAWRTIRVRPGRGVFEVRAGGGEYVVKAYEAGLVARMSPLRFCASGREWRAIAAVVKAGVRTAPPVGLVSGRGVNFVITEKLTGAAEFEAYLERERDRLLEDAKLARRLVGDFAAFVAGLHRAGLLHHDLHLRNILLRPPRKGQPAEFFVLDLADESLVPSTPLEGARLRNLAQLSLGFLDTPQSVKRRFLREYRRVVGDAGDETLAARAIAEQAAELMFNLNTLRIATCGDASSAIARVERAGVALLIARRASNADLSQLEQPLAQAEPARWGTLLYDHFELRLGEGSIWRLRSPIGGEAETRRKLEALWGRLLELQAIGVSAPAPLACLIQPPELTVFGAIPGRLSGLREHRGPDSLVLYEHLARQVLRMHRFGCFFLPMDPAATAEGLCVATPVRGGQTLVLCAPEHIFRGTPTVLGSQAVASLGRAARAVNLAAGERAMKELVWAYARVLRLRPADTQALMDEARRVPTGNTLVLTRGIERSRIA
ncbi:MAG: hypothetical protein HS108_13900 [Planctomycetes bacterium]|nr:hypothetical protein [Planctomycetota bacterium]